MLLDFRVHCNNFLFRKAEKELFEIPSDDEVASKMTFSRWRDKYSVNVRRYKHEAPFTESNYFIKKTKDENISLENPQITNKPDVSQEYVI